MQGIRGELGTISIVTAVAVLIWVWAAGETRTEREFNAHVRFTVPASWIVDRQRVNVRFKAEGSRLALERAEQALRRELSVALPAVAGRQTIDLMDVLPDIPHVKATGVRILPPTDPVAVELEIDEIKHVPARIRASLPGVQTIGEIEIEPPTAMVSLPVSHRQRLPGEIVLDAFIERSRLETLRPDIRHTLDAPLRLPETPGATADNVTIEPTTARVSFTVRSRIRELALESVRIQVAGPHEDHGEYVVELEDPWLRGVTISADADLIRRIENNEATVVAVLHLTSLEKEQRIERKPVAYFVALGGPRPVVVDARVGDSPELPPVNLRISRLARP
jgi:hypothetical protein